MERKYVKYMFFVFLYVPFIIFFDKFYIFNRVMYNDK
jgi:hypothetical protein